MGRKGRVWMAMGVVVLFFFSLAVVSCKNPSENKAEKKPEEVSKKEVPPPPQPQGGATASPPRERMSRMQIKLPENLLHCGNNPLAHGAVEDPNRPGAYTCPDTLPEEPVCAYFTGPRRPEMVRNHQFKNACVLCALLYSKDEKWESPRGTHILKGYEKGECTQGQYRLRDHMRRGRFGEGRPPRPERPPRPLGPRGQGPGPGPVPGATAP